MVDFLHLRCGLSYLLRCLRRPSNQPTPIPIRPAGISSRITFGESSSPVLGNVAGAWAGGAWAGAAGPAPTAGAAPAMAGAFVSTITLPRMKGCGVHKNRYVPG